MQNIKAVCQAKADEDLIGYHVVDSNGVQSIKKHSAIFGAKGYIGKGKIIFSALPGKQSLTDAEIDELARKTA